MNNVERTIKIRTDITTVEKLLAEIGRTTTPELEATMDPELIRAIHEKLKELTASIAEFHDMLYKAAMGSTDVAVRSGGGNGK